MKHSMILLLLASSSLLASIGEITAISGHAKLERAGKNIAIISGTKLEKHDSIHTQKGSKLQIVFNDKTVISLGQNSDFKVDEYIFEDKNVQASFYVTKGFFKSITGKIGKIAPSHFHVKTANATIGVRGTTIIGETSPQVDIIACTYGRIVVTTPQGSVTVNKGERTIVHHNMSPREAQKVNPILMKKLDQQSDVSKTVTPITPKATSQTSKHIIQKKQTKSNLITDQKQATQEQKLTQQTKTDDQTQPTQEEPSKTVPTQEDIHSLTDIKNIIGTQKPVYEGKITEGSTSFGEIKKDGINDVKLGFDLGSGAVDGHLKFEDPAQQYDIKVGGKVHNDATFDINAQNGYNGKGSGTLSGDKLKNANGDFDFSEHDLHTDTQTNHLQGKFETQRK